MDASQRARENKGDRNRHHNGHHVEGSSVAAEDNNSPSTLGNWSQKLNDYANQGLDLLKSRPYVTVGIAIVGGYLLTRMFFPKKGASNES